MAIAEICGENFATVDEFLMRLWMAGFAVVAWGNDLTVSVSYAALETSVVPDMVKNVLKRQIGQDMVARIAKR